MKIHENFHVIGIFHHDESNRMKVYTPIYLVSMFSGLKNFLLPETNAFTFRLFCFCLFLIQNI